MEGLKDRRIDQDRRIEGQKDRRIKGQTDRRIERYKNRRIVGQTDRIEGQKDRKIDSIGQKDRRIYRQKDRRLAIYLIMGSEDLFLTFRLLKSLMTTWYIYLCQTRSLTSLKLQIFRYQTQRQSRLYQENPAFSLKTKLSISISFAN